VCGFGNLFGGGEALHARKGIVPPSAIIVLRRHRLPEFSIIYNINSEIALLLHHVGDGAGKTAGISSVVLALVRGARAAHRD
jgi:hypothetical protein